MNILLSGASGFVGSRVLELLASQKDELSLLVRKPVEGFDCYFTTFDEHHNYQEALSGVDVVIHCAARTHIMKNDVKNPLSAYLKVNAHGTLNLAKQAAEAGVKRFVFLSSIKVNGETTLPDKPFSESVIREPDDPYSLSKYKAEQGMLKIAREIDMEVVIIRSPLVYGPKVKGNFASIIQLVKNSCPLPLACVKQNQRSLIALENLVDFILLCADYEKTPQAANQVFVISDNEDVSTVQLFGRIAKAYGIKCRLFPVPVSLLYLGAKLLGKQALSDRLMGSLQVDSSKAKRLLNWCPVVTMDEQLRQMAVADESINKGER